MHRNHVNVQEPCMSPVNAQEPCGQVDADPGVIWVESEQNLHLKVDCSNFGPAPNLVI